MLRIWGRANSVNVQKVLWCCEELGLPFERIDAGMQYGRNQDDDYLAMNPNGRVPTIEDDGFRLWESNSIIRYLALQYAPAHPIYPAAPRERAGMERWLDWVLTTLQPAERPVFWGYVRTDPADRNAAALADATEKAGMLWALLDRHLQGRRYLEAECFTLADLVMATYARRWFGIPEIVRPAMPDLERWYAAMQSRPGFQKVVAPPLS
ncbi:glutathione S-transferase family protein [Acidisphaera sp. L21]|uniref:glutathione S-transferase family protein n=1 Tax=Acidisphaera sp. L21 TaxID=1641851 RepID=UPI00131B7060|nr:glutathione S-transferase N-terminal domain-containing protein [Acidisphaera sp. L21]